MIKLKRPICAFVAVTTVVAAGVGSAPLAQAGTRRAVPHTTHAWVAKAKSLGRAKGSASITLKVYLAPQGGLDRLKATVAAVSDPSSPAYGKFLSAGAYHAEYDATDATVTKVTKWLKTQRLQVDAVETHHRYLTVRGTVAAVESAFTVDLQTYRHAGQTVRANTRSATVPAALAPYIATVGGLDSTQHKLTHDAAPPSPGFRNARPCSAYYGQVKARYKADFKSPLPTFRGKTLSYAPCGYTGPQYRAAYQNNFTKSDGAGVTVAITDAYASPTIVKDANTYAVRHGDGRYTAGQYTQVVPKSFNREEDCDPQGWYGEQTLDVEAVHAMAPGANIRYYASSSCYDDDFLVTLRKVVDENKASIVTNSWSDKEANESADNVVAYEQVFLQGAAQGVTFMFSSGDDGDEVASTGLRQVNYPASDPYVTAIGGTADAIGASGKFAFQTGWGTKTYALSANGKSWTGGDFLYGAGGGSSALFNRPDYQNGVVPNRYGAGRGVPDIGLDADPQTGMLVGQTQTFPDGAYYDEYRIGGTSLASPLFAGFLAVASAYAGTRVGFANPLIYSKAGTSVYTDIKGKPRDPGVVRVNYVNSVDASQGLAYVVRTFNENSSLAVATGWDNVTGVGSPKASWLTAIPRP